MKPPDYERVMEKAVQFTNEASRSNWPFYDVVKALKEAWVITHDNLVRHAKWEIEQNEKRD